MWLIWLETGISRKKSRNWNYRRRNLANIFRLNGQSRPCALRSCSFPLMRRSESFQKSFVKYRNTCPKNTVAL